MWLDWTSGAAGVRGRRRQPRLRRRAGAAPRPGRRRGPREVECHLCSDSCCDTKRAQRVLDAKLGESQQWCSMPTLPALMCAYLILGKWN